MSEIIVKNDLITDIINIESLDDVYPEGIMNAKLIIKINFSKKDYTVLTNLLQVLFNHREDSAISWNGNYITNSVLMFYVNSRYYLPFRGIVKPEYLYRAVRDFYLGIIEGNDNYMDFILKNKQDIYDEYTNMGSGINWAFDSILFASAEDYGQIKLTFEFLNLTYHDISQMIINSQKNYIGEELSSLDLIRNYELEMEVNEDANLDELDDIIFNENNLADYFFEENLNREEVSELNQLEELQREHAFDSLLNDLNNLSPLVEIQNSDFSTFLRSIDDDASDSIRYMLNFDDNTRGFGIRKKFKNKNSKEILKNFNKHLTTFIHYYPYMDDINKLVNLKENINIKIKKFL